MKAATQTLQRFDATHSSWARGFRLFFALIPTRAVRAMRKAVQIGPIEELVIVGRKSGHDRRVLIVLAQVGRLWYVGHPNGDSADWVLNLIAAGRATVNTRAGATTVRAVLLLPGEERNIAIREHTRQQKALPTRLLYRAARAYVTSAGAFFRLEPETAEAT
jgi:deazaflavin-dependent oxidoreductase (nitroreductase family)